MSRFKRYYPILQSVLPVPERIFPGFNQKYPNTGVGFDTLDSWIVLYDGREDISGCMVTELQKDADLRIHVC